MREQLKNTTTELLDGFQLSDGLWNSLCDIAQDYVEGQRQWMELRGYDETQTLTTNNTFETEKSLPSDFKRFYSRTPILLLKEKNAVSNLVEIPLNLKNRYKDHNNRFYVNYNTGKLYICGKPSETLTIQQNYIIKPKKISEDNDWVLNEKIIPVLIAIFHRRGIDYDIVGARNADELVEQAKAMLSNMAEDDSSKAEGTLQGQDYGGGGYGYSEMGGSINNLL